MDNTEDNINDLNIFQKIYDLLVSNTDLDKIAIHTTNMAIRYMHSSIAILTLLTDNQKGIYIHNLSSNLPEGIMNTTLKSDSREDISTTKNYHSAIKAIQTNKIIFSTDPADLISTHPKISIVRNQLTNIRAILFVPIYLKNKPLGTLILVFTKPPRELTEHELYLLKIFTKYVAYAINKSKIYKKEKDLAKTLLKQNNDLASLLTLTSEINKHLDPIMVTNTALKNMHKDKDLFTEMIILYDSKTHTLKLEASSKTKLHDKVVEIIGMETNQTMFDIDEVNSCNNELVKVLTSGVPAYGTNLNNILADIFSEAVIKDLIKLLPVSTYAIYPIISSKRSLGLLLFLFKDNHNIGAIDYNKKQLLYTYALQIGISLANATLFEHSTKITTNLKKDLNKLKKSRRRERNMIDMMGHELRTPITIVRNALMMIERQDKIATDKGINQKKLQEYLGMAIESTKREMVLIETLLTATKMDSDRLQISKEKVDMTDVIHDSIESQYRHANEKNIRIQWKKPAGIFFALADRVRIQEVMDNFLSNAVKYTMEGHVEITIRKNGENIQINVIDTGIGIDKKDIPHLGKKFFRAKQYINGSEGIVRPGGTGLGLYVAFKLMKAMNGGIIINSEIGKGSTFSFTIPIYANEKEIKYAKSFMHTKS